MLKILTIIVELALIPFEILYYFWPCFKLSLIFCFVFPCLGLCKKKKEGTYNYLPIINCSLIFKIDGATGKYFFSFKYLKDKLYLNKNDVF